MLRLKNRDIGPPQDGSGFSFRYLHRETAHWSGAADYYSWLDKIKAHRKANNLEPIAPDEAENQLCQSLPPEWCKLGVDDKPAPGVSTRFGWGDFLNGMSSFVKAAFTGFVSQEEANRRAQICSQCYFNVGIQGCGACRKMASAIVGDVAKKKTPFDDMLKACAVCKCAIKALVWFPISALSGLEEKQSKLPDFCWQRIGGENW